MAIDYDTEMGRIQIEMRSVMDAERASQRRLEAAFARIGYGIYLH